jgi:hypothetical protein
MIKLGPREMSQTSDIPRKSRLVHGMSYCLMQTFGEAQNKPAMTFARLLVACSVKNRPLCTALSLQTEGSQPASQPANLGSCALAPYHTMLCQTPKALSKFPDRSSQFFIYLS